jgi:hypothetical protein
MKKWLKYSLWVIFIVLVGIQFIPIQRNEIMPITATDFIEYYQPPIAIGKIIQLSCYDCHSEQTSYPWYSKVQPFAWLMQNHILEGKSELNFSEFGQLSNRMQRTKLKSIISQVDDNKMPIPSYLLLHSEAKLDTEKKVQLIKYIDSLVVNMNK